MALVEEIRSGKWLIAPIEALDEVQGIRLNKAWKAQTDGHKGVSSDRAIKVSDQKIDKTTQTRYRDRSPARSAGKNLSEKPRASALSKTTK